MLQPHTYRARLLVYTLLLLALLVGVLSFFFVQSREAIFGAASRSTALFAAEIEGKLRLQGSELRESARSISNDTQLRDYMYEVVSRGSRKRLPDSLFKREFGSLTRDHALIVSRTGRLLYGSDASALARLLKQPEGISKAADRVFDFRGSHDLEMAIAEPVSYRHEFLGNVILSRVIDGRLIDVARNAHYGEIFVVQGGHVVRSSLGDGPVGQRFLTEGGTATVGSTHFIVHRIAIAGATGAFPQIWFALSDPELVNRLRRSRNEMLFVAIGGSTAILFLGLIMLRNFSRPIGRLVRLMKQVREGHLPDTDIPPASDRDEIGYLINQFRSMLRRLRENQSEVKRVQAQLEQQATTDALTGLYNRRYLYDVFPKLWGEAERQGNTLTVIIVDLDYFKQVNDLCGHLVGDRVLAHVAQIFSECCRVSDFVFRLGGEEFLILTSGGTVGGEVLAEKIRSSIEKSSMEDEGRTIAVTASFGVARVAKRDGADALRSALTRADKALYTAKHSGRNRVALWDLRQVNG